jgi:hypothetical protein
MKTIVRTCLLSLVVFDASAAVARRPDQERRDGL